MVEVEINPGYHTMQYIDFQVGNSNDALNYSIWSGRRSAWQIKNAETSPGDSGTAIMRLSTVSRVIS